MYPHTIKIDFIILINQNLLKEFDTSFSKSNNMQELKNLKTQAI